MQYRMHWSRLCQSDPYGPTTCGMFEHEFEAETDESAVKKADTYWEEIKKEFRPDIYHPQRYRLEQFKLTAKYGLE